MSLRQALARRQVSVSMAWDAKQAMDLLHQARPDAMVIDLDLPKRDGYLLVSRGVAQLDPPPYTLLVGGRSGSGRAFAEALAALGTGRARDGAHRRAHRRLHPNATASVPDDARRPKRLPYGSRGRTKG
jgi:CheY-like chemotaxis protein